MEDTGDGPAKRTRISTGALQRMDYGNVSVTTDPDEDWISTADDEKTVRNDDEDDRDIGNVTPQRNGLPAMRDIRMYFETEQRRMRRDMEGRELDFTDRNLGINECCTNFQDLIEDGLYEWE